VRLCCCGSLGRGTLTFTPALAASEALVALLSVHPFVAFSSAPVRRGSARPHGGRPLGLAPLSVQPLVCAWCN
jgi:hypothetical protein